MKPAIQILVVDDQPAIRRGLRMWLALEPDLTVVGEAANGLEALRLADRLRPDVIVMDVEMPHMDGLAATEALRTIAPGAAVVILSLYDNPAVRARASEAGAAFVLKQAGAEALVAAIRRTRDAARHSGPPT